MMSGLAGAASPDRPAREFELESSRQTVWRVDAETLTFHTFRDALGRGASPGYKYLYTS